jgi:hypothetical protein
MTGPEITEQDLVESLEAVDGFARMLRSLASLVGVGEFAAACETIARYCDRLASRLAGALTVEVPPGDFEPADMAVLLLCSVWQGGGLAFDHAVGAMRAAALREEGLQQ